MADKQEEKQARDDKQGDLLEIVETDSTDKGGEAPAPKKGADAEQGDSRMSADADDEDDKGDDTPDADPERERLRQERKLRRKIQKEFKREARDKERAELEELRLANRQLLERMQHLESAQTGATETTLKTHLRQAVQVYEEANEDVRLAIEAGDGKRATAALERRDKAKESAQMLDQQLRRLQNNGKKQMGPDPQETRLYQEWLSQNSWFDTNLANEESRMAKIVNDALLQEGYQANTPAFWRELSNRVEKFVKVPKNGKRSERQDDDDDSDRSDPPPRRGGPPVAGSGREGAVNTGKTKVYITPERKRAMQEAGVWDDPDLRQKYLKAYSKYDRENPSQRAN